MERAEGRAFGLVFAVFQPLVHFIVVLFFGGEILRKLGPIDDVGFGAGDLVVNITRILILIQVCEYFLQISNPLLLPFGLD